MKKIMQLSVLAVLCMFVSSLAIAAPADKKGASDMAKEKASDHAIFSRVGDWFATIGKSEKDKALIKAERQKKRELKREEKAAKKKAKQAEKEAKQKAEVKNN